MEKIIEEMLSEKVWVVVGATENKGKFGYRIYKKLKECGYKVYAVNPKYDSVDGDKCYPNFSELPEKPTCINMVVAPEHAKAFIEEAARLQIPYMWFQPGTFDQNTLDEAQMAGLKLVYYNCVLVELARNVN